MASRRYHSRSASSSASSTSPGHTSLSSDSFANLYPLLSIDEERKRVACTDGDGTKDVRFKVEDFAPSDQKILQKLFKTISEIKRWAPTSRDPPKTKFLTKYQYVYRVGRSPARLIKRSEKLRYRNYCQDYKIVNVRFNGSVDCEFSIGVFNGEEQFRSTTFELWEFTDVDSYTTLLDLARRSKLRQDACYRDTARKRNQEHANDIYYTL